MSQGRFSPPLAPEDDWFDEPGWFDEPDGSPSASGEESHEPRTRPPEPAHSVQRPPRRRNRRLMVGALIAGIALLVGGALVARALTGSDAGSETTEPPPTTTLPTTTATTPVETTTAEPTGPTTTDTTGTPDAGSDVSLRPGDESEEVRQLQTDLVALGYSTGGVDGKFGPATEEAVRDFQTSSGLVVDGVAGAATLAALAQALNG